MSELSHLDESSRVDSGLMMEHGRPSDERRDRAEVIYDRAVGAMFA